MANIDGEPHANHNLFSLEPPNLSSGRYYYCIWGHFTDWNAKIQGVKQVAQVTRWSDGRTWIQIQVTLLSPGLIMDTWHG